MTLVVVSAAAYALPLYGLPISLCLPILAVSFRQQLWEGSTRRLCLLCGVLAWVGLWWPAIVGFVTGWVLGAAEPISTAWLLIPLCGPDGPGVIALPALVAGLVNATGLVASVVARQPWLWVAAAWVAPWAHHLVLAALPHQYIC